MGISSAQIKAYANYFLPQFQFADTETVFPLDAESWLQQCAQGDWKIATDPHRGTTAVTASVPLSLATLDAQIGCNGVSGTPIDPSKPLPFSSPNSEEAFLDYAGWSSLETGDGFVAGDDDYIKTYLAPYFGQFNSALLGAGVPARTKQTLPKTMTVYCEAAWAGAFTRLDIQNGTMDFAPAQTNDPSNLTPDTALDPFIVLTYYLFYPATEPPPSIGGIPVTSPNLLQREGQWEAVSFYFNGVPAGVPLLNPPSELQLPSDPSQAKPAYVMLSYGITLSGDGRSPGLATNYPANPYSPAPSGSNVEVWVTSGTHKNLSSSTSVISFVNNPAPGPSSGAEITGAALEGAGGIVAGTTGGTGVGLAVGFLLWLIGFIISLLGDPASGSTGTVTTTDAPDPSGDVANSGGPLAGPVPAPAGQTFVD